MVVGVRFYLANDLPWAWFSLDMRPNKMEEKGPVHSLGWLEPEQVAERHLVVGPYHPSENHGPAAGGSAE